MRAPGPAPTLRVLIAILAAGCLTTARAAAQDGPRHVSNLDTTVINATVVMVGRFVETFSSNVTAPGRTWTFVVEEKLKGDVRDPAQVLNKTPKATLDTWKTQGHRLLVIDSVKEKQPSVIDLSASDLKVLRADMTVLQDAGSVISAAREAIGDHPGDEAIVTFMKTLPLATVRILMRGSDAGCAPDKAYPLCPLTPVPVDEALERWAVDAIQSKQVWERAEGAAVLRHFPSDANITRLKVLLVDPGVHPDADGQVHLVRRRAYESLSRMGVRVPEPAARPLPQ